MEHDAEGRIFDVGAKTRTIPPALRRALLYRDRRCRFPGCHGRFCQAHHIRHWAHGGPTTLSNLVLVCRRHHRAVHEEGYRVERMADGELEFRGPDGRVVPDVPCPPRAPADPVTAVRTDNEEGGIVVGPRTATPAWQGERLDVGYAIDVLHPLANEKRTAAGAERGQSPLGE
jgi:HNH endonuclease